MLFYLIAGSYLIGFICALSALWRSRTPQGATAWVVALLSFPFLSVPLFLLFGRNRFYGYVKKRQEYEETIESFKQKKVTSENNTELVEKLSDLARQPPFTKGNKIKLLVNADETYERMLEELAAAQNYILFQFYTFRCDEIGAKFAELLMQKAREGVKIFFLCDKMGTELNGKFIRSLRNAGIEADLFDSSKNWKSRFQINFRNHRKIIVVDGERAFVGGLNIGDEYLGRWREIGPWRDTHVELLGPAALTAQLSFMKDWYWTREELPELNWSPKIFEDGADALVLHTGPVDKGETCLLTLISLINSANERVWISNPYFVPPEGLVNALELAAFRGVEVHILIPSYSDNKWILFASEVYQERLLRAGIRFFQYLPGFLHQKVILIDQQTAVVGSVNLDLRSIFINFEIMVVSKDKDFIGEVERMLKADFDVSAQVKLENLMDRPLPRQILSRAVNLAAPML